MKPDVLGGGGGLEVAGIRPFFLLFALFTLLLSGCGGHSLGVVFPVKGKGESVHYLIFGFGVVTVAKNHQSTAVLATKSQTLGVVVSDQPDVKLGIGYSSSQVVAVPDGAKDVRVEIYQAPGGPINIDTFRADLISDGEEGENEVGH